MQGLKINECGDQIVPIPIQRNNCIESVRLRKEILVNSAKMQESVQPLVQAHWAHKSTPRAQNIPCWPAPQQNEACFIFIYLQSS